MAEYKYLMIRVMRIEIDSKSGFCFGVVRAIDKVEELLGCAGETEDGICGNEKERIVGDDKNTGISYDNNISGSCSTAEYGAGQSRKIYCLGDIVHNRVEVSRLQGLGLQTINHSDIATLSGQTMLIRAHGEPPATYSAAALSGVEVVDATCPVVARLQKTVKTAYKTMQEVNGQVVILGKKGHPEVIGLSGQVSEDVVIVESTEDLQSIDFQRPIYLLSQTTQSLELFEKVSNLILEKSPTATIHDTICRQVSNRNPHLREFAARFDVVIFVSGKKSSNGKALLDVCQSVNPRTYFVEEWSELQKEWFAGAESVGICGATSTPRWIMEQVAQAIGRDCTFL